VKAKEEPKKDVPKVEVHKFGPETADDAAIRRALIVGDFDAAGTAEEPCCLRRDYFDCVKRVTDTDSSSHDGVCAQ